MATVNALDRLARALAPVTIAPIKAQALGFADEALCGRLGIDFRQARRTSDGEVVAFTAQRPGGAALSIDDAAKFIATHCAVGPSNDLAGIRQALQKGTLADLYRRWQRGQLVCFPAIIDLQAPELELAPTRRAQKEARLLLVPPNRGTRNESVGVTQSEQLRLCLLALVMLERKGGLALQTLGPALRQARDAIRQAPLTSAKFNHDDKAAVALADAVGLFYYFNRSNMHEDSLSLADARSRAVDDLFSWDSNATRALSYRNP